MKEYTTPEKYLPNTDYIPEKIYRTMHRCLPIVCHDVLISYKSGVLLVKRNLEPGKGKYFPVGGRLKKGKNIIESLTELVKEETDLDLENIVELSPVRVFFNEDPFQHYCGTDNIILRYHANAYDKIKLDENHSKYTIVKKGNVIRKKLHPYVNDFINEVLK